MKQYCFSAPQIWAKGYTRPLNKSSSCQFISISSLDASFQEPGQASAASSGTWKRERTIFSDLLEGGRYCFKADKCTVQKFKLEESHPTLSRRGDPMCKGKMALVVVHFFVTV